jgi:hypothetical protein
VLFVGSVLISSCKKLDNEAVVYANARVRVINAIAASSSQDFYQGDNKISTIPVSYGNYSSSYLTIAGGPSVVSFRNSGSGNVTVTKTIGAEENASYSIYLYTNSAGTADIAGFYDDPALPAAGKAKIRFINFGFSLNNSLNITYAGSGTVIVGNLGNVSSSYYAIDANTDLGVTVIGSPTTGLIAGSNFASGKIYTVWFDSATSSTANFHVVAEN